MTKYTVKELILKMDVVEIIINYLPLFIFSIVGIIFICGLLYRKKRNNPFKGDIPSVGIYSDLPSSVTGMNKNLEHDEYQQVISSGFDNSKK